MRAFIKFFPVFCYFMLVPWHGNAADTIKIHLTYKHKLDEAGRSKGFTTINQKFYTPEQVLFREINYDEQTGQITSYIFFFYTGDKLSTEECYNQKDSLLYILKHEYNATGKENKVVRLEPDQGSLKVMHTTVKSYDKSGNLIQKKEYTGRKQGILTVFEYKNPGILTRELRKYKPVSRQPLKSEIRLYNYDENNVLTRVSVSGKDLSNKDLQGTEEYTYNGMGQLSSVAFSGSDYPAGLVKTYKYIAGGTLSIYQESDAGGKIKLILRYDYKKHFMDQGTQISYFNRQK